MTWIRLRTVCRTVTNDSVPGDIDVWGQRLKELDKVTEKCLW